MFRSLEWWVWVHDTCWWCSWWWPTVSLPHHLFDRVGLLYLVREGERGRERERERIDQRLSSLPPLVGKSPWKFLYFLTNHSKLLLSRKSLVRENHMLRYFFLLKVPLKNLHTHTYTFTDTYTVEEVPVIQNYSYCVSVCLSNQTFQNDFRQLKLENTISSFWFSRSLYDLMIRDISTFYRHTPKDERLS